VYEGANAYYRGDFMQGLLEQFGLCSACGVMEAGAGSLLFMLVPN
jgi:hypothetical protein